ncbi:methyltransferase domain-containing protein [Candidatus Daviesbacteria bacterium]|nr:methyltransferase domain-containing protein [Candidatus Daviesbacteria bacterium]
MELTFIITGGVLLGCFIGLSWFAGSDAPFVPTKQEKIKKALKLVNLKGKNFYELGSGDGRIVLEAARMGAEAYGIEQSWIRVLYSRWKARQRNLPNANFFHGNIFQKDLSDADVIFIYLLHEGVAKLKNKLKKEVKKDAKIITQTYHFKNWKPYKKSGDFWLYRV